MFVYSLFQVIGYTGAKNSVIFIRHNVNIELFNHQSFFLDCLALLAMTVGVVILTFSSAIH